MILCGGMGTRLRDVTELLPKPLVPIGEFPIVWHIMKCYAAFGIKRFILCLGYKREEFIDYFLNYRSRVNDVTVSLGGEQSLEIHGEAGNEDWQVTLANTGLETKTGGRIRKAAKYLNAEDHDFFLTYGDGVADLNMRKLFDFHLSHGKMLSCSAVQPAARFGELALQGNRVLRFEEKPAHAQGYINGGFMVAKKSMIEKYISATEDQFFESQPIDKIVKDGEMQAYRHEGFWQCMDNPREYQLLNELWRQGQAPWTKYWSLGNTK
ncbi:MAG: glucose-1-phosphate cytidylyltransferase [Oligosphaeraceae bacterium]|nr:glucose-1-phosphate cytidylyltransferase [Oligosphaeraceae bacterium]